MRKLIDSFIQICGTQWFWLVAFVLMCSVVVVLPIFIGGLHASGDLDVYIGFTKEIRAAVLSGDLFPGWANDNQGFGSLGIRFYPPLVPYLTTAISILTNSTFHTIWIYFALCMIVGCSGIYLFVRDLGTPVQAVCAGILYAIIPFPLAEIYQFSLLAEFAAGSLIPFCFYFATRICHSQGWTDTLLFAVSFSLLILTHIPTTIITTISLSIYVLLIIEWRNAGKALLVFGVGATFALLTSAFYWIKVITEISWLAHSRAEFSADYYGFRIWLFPNSIFREFPESYLQHYRNIDAMIVLTFFLLVPVIGVWLTGRGRPKIKNHRVVFALTLTASFAFFMTTRASSFVWAEFPLLQRTQFPWRWLTVTSGLSTICFVLSLTHLWRRFPYYKTVVGFCAAGLIVLMLSFDVRQSFARWNRISRSQLQEMEEVKYSNPAWWPIWANAKAFDLPDRVIAGGREVNISNWEREERRFEIADGPSAEVRVATFYYPHWRATVNGQAVEVSKDENGAITIPVGKGISDVSLHFEEPPLSKTLLWVSIISWLILSLTIRSRIFRARKSEGGNNVAVGQISQ